MPVTPSAWGRRSAGCCWPASASPAWASGGRCGGAGVVGGRPAGAMVDRFGDLRVIVTGSLVCAVLLPLAVLVPDVALLAAVWMLAGVGSQLVWAGLNTLLV